MSSKNPQQPPLPLTLQPGEVRLCRDPLFRIHSTAGAHPMQWNDLREFGPMASMRWDPQPSPAGVHPGVGVAYVGTDVTTAFAEVFQSRRAINLTPHRALSAWIPERHLRLLDLTGLWPIKHGASASLHAAPKSTCRNWARSIHEQLGEQIDGLYAPSTMTLTPMVVLYSGSATAFPVAPSFSRPLSHGAVRMLAIRAASALGWPVS